ncbi:universal stress protein [Pseudoduganella sp. FT25W]|jgi:nucleotide-binding universal stress UspA family protein|uniref:Universal stress protein n=1 Tax=Duganella alba TaxID=2666081 RepID=A0A6L5QMT9_9BURK|nr:universal stress protein [Duganella alba]MRX10758.1 universal stress protein [Duganella alba]MRX18877.1 universal stress protein [Duganella alba]
MFKTILLPTDGSDLSDKATATAMEFARLHQSRIIALTVIQPMLLPAMGDGGAVLEAGQYETQMQDAARDHINKVAAAASAAGIPFEGFIAMSASASDEIVEAAKKHGCDLIMMASHGRTGLSKLLLGSETQSVLSHTSLPVLVLR